MESPHLMVHCSFTATLSSPSALPFKLIFPHTTLQQAFPFSHHFLENHLLRKLISQAQVVQCEVSSRILPGFPKCLFASYQGLSTPAGDGATPLLSSPSGQAASPEGCTTEHPFLSCAKGEYVDPFLSLISQHGFSNCETWEPANTERNKCCMEMTNCLPCCEIQRQPLCMGILITL